MKTAVIVATLLLAVTATAADPAKSGPQPGEKVPGPFRPLNLIGPNAGEKVCQYCNNGANPVVMVFARETTPAVMTLVKSSKLPRRPIKKPT